MRFFILGTVLQCFLFSLIFAESSAQHKKLEEISISISENNISLEEAFSMIEGETGLKFSYIKSRIPLKERLEVASPEDLRSFLEILANHYKLNFKRINDQIIVKKVKKVKRIEEIFIINEIKVSGKVTEFESGEPLVGASIQVKGTNLGTITDIDGNFNLSIPEDSETLMVSYIGYQPKEIEIGNQTNFEIALLPDTETLSEIVVVGYGTSTKESFNGAVSKTDSKKLNNYSSANFEQSMAGLMAGVQVLGNSKNPGDNSVIQIRGLNTLTAGTSPLIVVDGNPLTEGTSFSSINTNDIESINILKDAASAAIYGSRASNGVILITTKKGKDGSLKVSYNGYVGVQQRIDKFELADAYGAAQFDYDARNFGYISGGPGRSITDNNDTRDANGGGKRSRIPTHLADYVNGVPGLTNTNWTDAVFRDALQQSHHLNLGGGTGKTDYSVSFGYLDQDNIIVDSDYKRYSSNIRLNSQVNDRIRFGINSNISFSNANPTGEAAWSRSRIGRRQQADPAFSIILMQPFYPIYNSDGSYAIAAQLNDNNENWDGPISENTIAQAGLSDFTRDEFRVFGNTYLEIEPIDDLIFKTSFGGDFNTKEEEYFGPSTFGDYRTPVANNSTQAANYNSRRENFINENILTYKKSIKAHNFDALFGFSYQQEVRHLTDLESRDFADDNIRNIGGATSSTSVFNRSKWALVSYFSRLQYEYDARYSLSASLRRDGSSRFGANTKYGTFASLSAGWTLSEESFFPQNNTLTFTKLRASWGQTGNNQIGDFASIALVSPDNYVIDGNLTPGVYTRTSPNADLSWETNSAVNFGLDLGFFDNKLLLTAEYYNSVTTDLLLDVPVPQQSGFSESLQNVGELKNKGFELELIGRGFSLGEVQLGFNTNFTTNTNEVHALGEGQEQIISSNGGMGFITKIGEPISQFYAYDIIGVYKSQLEIDNDNITPLSGTEVGDYIVRDANGDGVVTPDDRVPLGDYNPEFIYGFGFNLTYRAFDLNVQFYGLEGRKVSDRMLYYAESGEGFFVPSQYYMENYFNESNPEGFFRRPDFSSFSSAGRLTRSSDLSVYDGDYFRLRSLQLGYNLPSNLTDKISLEAARIYVTANNLFNITKYRGYNSDGLDTSSNESQTLTRGFIPSTSPLTRFVALGVNIKF